MQKPAGYDDIKIDQYEMLKPGGHYCVIKEVNEAKSKTLLDMLVIYFDTDDVDSQPGYYANRFLRDKKSDKDDLKWRGTMYIVVDGNTDYGSVNLKRFCTAVEDSNPGFQIQWGQNFAKCFKGLKIGMVFREEEYTKWDGQVGYTVKPMRVCNYADALTQKVPKTKFQQQAEQPSLQQQYQAYAAAPQPQQMTFGDLNTQDAANEGFMQLPPDALEDEGLPFN